LFIVQLQVVFYRLYKRPPWLYLLKDVQTAWVHSKMQIYQSMGLSMDNKSLRRITIVGDTVRIG
jgi:hypothetical protein